ncbi:MAG: hypothetical protein QOF02_2340 [Blastocatellia bacterium]|nr:hypothetical protein [Blastocatellia bacterium]
MLFKLTGTGRRLQKSALRRRGLQLGAALALALVLPVAACAYTVVMRGGRRIEIPAAFIVTSQTLTYETAPGINITLMMTAVDIAATERANNEPMGSLLRRAQATAAPGATPASKSAANTQTQARRTLTNKDLEASRQARLRSEADYERRRIELGLPSLDEVRRRNALESERAREQLQQSESDEAQAEGYWRSRAGALRAEIAALDAEINYMRARLDEEVDYVNAPFTSVTTLVPSFGSHPFNTFPQPVLTGNPGFIHAANAGLQVSGSVGFGGGHSRSQAVLNVRPGLPLVAPPLIVGQSVFAPPFAAYSAGPFPGYYPSYERSALIARLHETEATRAGLQARWRLLEDEARRAGALPGWLRP